MTFPNSFSDPFSSGNAFNLQPTDYLRYVTPSQPSTGSGSPRPPQGGGGPGGGGSNGGGGGSAVSGVYAAANGGFDLWGTSAGYFASRLPAGQNIMTSYQPSPKAFPFVYRVDLHIRDLSGGNSEQVAFLSDGPFTNKTANSTTDTSFAKTLALPPLLTTDNSSANEIGELDCISSCLVKESGAKKRIVGGGDVTDKALFVATTSMTAQTYTPTSNVVSLTPVYIATAAERVMVGRDSDVAQILTGFSGTPTVSGSMHANTEPLWGAVFSPLNSATPGAGNIVMYANGGIWLLASTASISTAPTQTLSCINDGGYGGWIQTWSSDNVARAYFMEPDSDQTVSALTAGVPCHPFSVNLEGTDKKVHETGLPFCIHATAWRQGLVVTDGKTINWLTGDVTNLGWNQGRKRINANGQVLVGSVQCLMTWDNRLFAFVANLNDAGNYNELTTLEEFIPEANNGNGAWYVHCQAVRAAGLLPNVAAFTKEAAAYSPYDTTVDAGNLWWYTKVDGGLVSSTYEWANIFIEPNGLSPFDHQQEGAQVTYKFGTSGSATAPIYHFFDGYPKVWADATFGGDLKGEDSTVTIEMALQDRTKMRFSGQTLDAGGAAVTQTAIFREDDDSKSNFWANPSPQASMGNRVQFKFTVAQGTSGSFVTQSSPNALPIRLGFYVYLDGVYHEPAEIEDWRYGGLA